MTGAGTAAARIAAVVAMFALTASPARANVVSTARRSDNPPGRPVFRT